MNELSAIVSTTNRKMDKSMVLKSTIGFLKNHNGKGVENIIEIMFILIALRVQL